MPCVHPAEGPSVAMEHSDTATLDLSRALHDGGGGSFARRSMKQPRLPGTEKFKFSGQVVSLRSASQSSPSSSPGEWNGSSLAPSLSVQSLHRHDLGRRRAVLPITCKKTSRVLTNTNLELNVNPIDLHFDHTAGLQILSAGRRDASRAPSCPNLEAPNSGLTSRRTLSDHCRQMSLHSHHSREHHDGEPEWMNLRSSESRLSASSHSSMSSEDNVWVMRNNDE